MNRKPIVGETLYRLNIGNAARNRKQELSPVVVISVGRKYFYVRPQGTDHDRYDAKISIETWYQDAGGYSPNYRLYESPQTWADEKEVAAISQAIADKFRYWRDGDMTLEKLREVARVLGIEVKQ